MKKILLSLVIILILGSVLAGCASQKTATIPLASSPASTTTSAPKSTPTAAPSSAPTAAPTPTPTPASTVVPGGVLQFLYNGPMSSFGYPVEYRGQEAMYGYPCFEALWHVDKNVSPTPWLATSWDIAPGWKSVTFHLRQGVKFQDGTDWNAQAAKYTLDAKKARNDTGTDIWGSIDLIDDYTLRMNFSTFQCTQITILGQTLFASPTAIAKNGLDWARYNPVGTGPFKFSSFKRDVSIDYVRNDAYWGDKPYLDGIQFIFFAALNTGSSALQTGAGQLLYTSAVDPTIHSDLQRKGFTVTVVKQAVAGLAPDSSDNTSPFSNKNVRLALEYAIDREAICKTLGGGYWDPLYEYCYPGWYGYNPTLEKRMYDPVKAKQLLSQAGYPNGFKTKLNYGSGDPAYLAALQSYLGNVGINADVNIVGAAKAGDMAQKTGWNGLGLMNLSAGLWGNSVTWSLQFLFGTPWDQISVQRPAGYLDLLNKLLATDDLNAREELVRQELKLVYDEAMVLPIYMTGPTFAERPGVHGVDHFESGIKFWWDPGKVWLDKAVR